LNWSDWSRARRVDDLPAGFLQGDRVAVYLPMGYMIGGYTVFVPP